MTIFGSVKHAHDRYRTTNSSRTDNQFHSLGPNYKAPSVDHKYKIKYAPNLGISGERPKSSSYMSVVVRRAKLMVDPSKYASQNDWKKNSMKNPTINIPRATKQTMTEEIIKKKKNIPPPNAY